MTKMSKIKINARRTSKAASGAVKNALRRLSHAQLESQVAELQEQIARLQEDASKTPPEARSLKPEARDKLPAPELRATVLPAPQDVQVTLLGGTRLRVQWEPVVNASGYSVRYSTNSTFNSEVSWSYVDPNVTTRMLYDLNPETTYYIGVRAFGTGDWQDSNYSASQTVTTGMAGGGNGGGNGGGGGDGDTVGDLQSWLNALQTVTQGFHEILPQLETTVLSPADRRRLLGSGVRRYGFIDKVSDVAAFYPQFWPASVHGADVAVDYQAALKYRLREIEVLRNLLVWSRWVSRVVGDLLLIAGDDAFRKANTYYSTVRTAARNNLPEAQQVYQLLQLFWERRRGTSSSDEPTLHAELFGRSTDIERDFKRLIHGKADGDIFAKHESPTTSGGVHEVIDNVR